MALMGAGVNGFVTTFCFNTKKRYDGWRGVKNCWKLRDVISGLPLTTSLSWLNYCIVTIFWGQFHQHFKSSFWVRRSPKRKKHWRLGCLFALFFWDLVKCLWNWPLVREYSKHRSPRLQIRMAACFLLLNYNTSTTFTFFKLWFSSCTISIRILLFSTERKDNSLFLTEKQ